MGQPRATAAKPQALQVHAGPLARAHLREHGLQPAHVGAIPAAAGGPKGLTLLPLDRFIFGHWLAGAGPAVHLLGASIGAWRMAAACMPQADAALAQLAEDYITQSYPHAPGRFPAPDVVSRHLAQKLDQRLGAGVGQMLAHPRLRLHVFTSRGRGLLHRPGRMGLPLGWAGAFAANALSRSALSGFMQRVVFSDPRAPLPLPLAEFPTHRAVLGPHNLTQAVLASCSIPFALAPVHDVPGGPAGSYWDGGITDYHLHLDYRPLWRPGQGGLVLYPHFVDHVVPGWLDKAWKRRHRATPALDNLVLLSPSPEWVRSLPGGKLPDRQDFKSFMHDEPGRQRVWRQALAESRRLADEFAELVDGSRPIDALPLC
jgi:hypothetical protein